LSPDNRSDGVPRATVRLAALPGKARVEEQLAGANEASDVTLQVRRLRRRARDAGYEVRHSDHGYSLVDPAHQTVNGRRDLSLRDVALLLDEALKP